MIIANMNQTVTQIWLHPATQPIEFKDRVFGLKVPKLGLELYPGFLSLYEQYKFERKGRSLVINEHGCIGFLLQFPMAMWAMDYSMDLDVIPFHGDIAMEGILGPVLKGPSGRRIESLQPSLDGLSGSQHRSAPTTALNAKALPFTPASESPDSPRRSSDPTNGSVSKGKQQATLPYILQDVHDAHHFDKGRHPDLSRQRLVNGSKESLLGDKPIANFFSSKFGFGLRYMLGSSHAIDEEEEDPMAPEEGKGLQLPREAGFLCGASFALSL